MSIKIHNNTYFFTKRKYDTVQYSGLGDFLGLFNGGKAMGIIQEKVTPEFKK